MQTESFPNLDHQRAVRQEFDAREQELDGIKRIMGRRLTLEECIPASQQYVQDVLAHIDGAFQDKDVVEVGTGVGRFTPLLAQQARSVVGLDFSQRMVAATQEEVDASKSDNVRLMQASATQLPLLDNSADAIFASEVYFHISPEPDFSRAMDEVQRVLRPGGIAFISEALSPTDEPQQIHDYLRFRTLEDYRLALFPMKIGNIATSQVIDQTNTMFFAYSKPEAEQL